MIRVEVYLKSHVLWRFRVEGHAGYARHGEDIVCSSVSTLVLNTINSIEELTEEVFILNEVDNQTGTIDCEFPNRKLGVINKESELLLNSMLLGLKSIEQMYGEYITIKKNS
ncbi:MAG: ribosomal-processing cysteine protease Prp [Cellulosilyticaceae bacterium]